jgi:hypothetical protein
MVKLPRTLHIEGSRMKRGQVDPDAIEFNKLRGEFLVVEEKVDGTGVCIFFNDNLEPQVWHRGSQATGPEFRNLYQWVSTYENELFDLLENRYILFGEWMFSKHTIFYDRLPDYFLESDVYDRQNDIWLSTLARNTFFDKSKFIKHVPVIASLKPTSLEQLTSLIGKPKYQSDYWRKSMWDVCEKSGRDTITAFKEKDTSHLMEGLYIKHEDDQKIIGRYKYVRYEFVNLIINSGTHLRDRVLVKNQLIERW